jgi:2-oxoisovalerate dehydrogenase E2 component (dihydrolipoyl transacylase)
MNSLYHPDVNPYEYSIHPTHNISIAIDSPNGLVVPHIKGVNRLTLSDIQSELDRLRVLATEAKLTGKELIGGTVCLSNIGTIGGTHACPLILPPQVCIVAIGKMQSIPKYRSGELVERKTLNVSFGCDHRVVDGATVARFSNHWKQLIENPYLAIADLV